MINLINKSNQIGNYSYYTTIIMKFNANRIEIIEIICKPKQKENINK